jgi:ribonucleoside-diphosphate reductase alpha chain
VNKDVYRLLGQRYLQPGEGWGDLVSRVVNHVCHGESEKYKAQVYTDIHNRTWLPNSPCLVSSGRKNGGLMACFVVGPTEDTLEDHGHNLVDIATVGKRGGGCGFTGTHIRPKGSLVAGSAHDSGTGIAYGPNAWALRVSDYLDMITQGGFRKMALMYTLSSDHEDLDDFIELKQNKDERFCYNFNQSIFATDDWMLSANGQFDKLVANAWNNGEPGLLFADTINANTPYNTCGCKIYTTNPCGEQPLPPYGSCNLGSINLAHDTFFANGDPYDYLALARVVETMTRFLDNVGLINIFPNIKFEHWYEQHRPIGIGIMGYADALLNMGIAYGSEKALNFLGTVMEIIKEISYMASGELAEERGTPEHCKDVRRRNITTTSIAPTGSIAFISECSHGIEPIFSPVYQRTDERGEKYIFRHTMKDEPFFRSSLNDNKKLVPSWQEHIYTQAAAQEHCDSAISKTINMFNGVKPSDVASAMQMAWTMKCKGITIYRNGSRDIQVLEEVTEKDANKIDCPTGICDI